MKMLERNPFVVLGLSPEAIRGLKSIQIQAIVKNLIRGLRFAHHPDRGGSNEKMQELNRAVEQLEDARKFMELKELFLKKSTMRQQIDSLEAQVTHTASALSIQLNTMLQFILCSHGLDSRPNIFGFEGDIFIRDIVRDKNAGDQQFSQNMQGVISGDICFLLSIQRGVIVKKFLKRESRKNSIQIYREQEFPKKKLIGALSNESIIQLGGKNMIIDFLHQGIPSIQPKALIGERLKPMYHAQKRYANRISLECFKVIIANITPFIEMESMLFALNLGVDGESFVSIEGVVVKAMVVSPQTEII
ncbi:MAG: hypothetical protein NT091_04105 [Candidatus Falkowbacteria bacterium]|nr:hypothetical protein [Candidatus Falkowbacteria bacterium]